MIAINLLRWSEQQKIYSLRILKRNLFFVSLICIALIGGWYGGLRYESYQVKQELQQSENLVTQRHDQYFAAEQKEHALKLLQMEIISMRELDAKAKSVIIWLTEISKVIPKEIGITTLKFTQSKIILNGNTFAVTAVSEFLQRLTKSDLFAGVALEGITNSSSNSNFIINLTLKPYAAKTKFQ